MTSTLIVAAMLALVCAQMLVQSGLCLKCGGRGAHRDDCPLKEN